MFGGGSGTNVIETKLTASGADAVAAEFSQAAASSKKFKTAVAGLGTGLAAVSAGGIAKATQAAVDFESQMAEVQKVTSEAVADEMSGKIQQMAKDIPLTTKKLASLTEQAGRFGVEGTKNIKEFTRNVAKMATATDLTADEAGTAFAKLSTLTKTPIPQTENLGSAINELSNTAAASSSEITDTMLRASGTLTQLGMSTTDIVALSGAMNEVSSSARRAGSGLRRVGQEIKNPKKVSDFAAALGITSQKFRSLRDNSPIKLFKMMAKEMANNTEKGKALRKQFSTYSRKTLSSLGQNIEGVNDALETSSKAFEENTSLQREFAIQSKTAANQLKLLKNSITVVAQESGGVFLPAFAAIISVIKDGINAFSDFNSALNGVPGAVVLVSGVIGGLTTAFTALQGTIAASSIYTLGSVFLAVLGPVSAVAAAVAALAAAWQKDFAGIRSATTRVAKSVKKYIGGIATFAFDELSGKVDAAKGVFKGFVSGIEGPISRFVQLVSGKMVGAVQGFASYMEPTIVALSTDWENHGTAVSRAIEGGYGAIAGVVKTALGAFRSVVDAATAGATEAWNRHGNMVTRYLKIGYTAALKAVKAVTGAIGSAVANVTARINALWQKHGAGLQDSIGNPYRMIRTTVLGVLDTLFGGIVDVAQKMRVLWYEHGSAVKKAITTAYNAVGGVALAALRELAAGVQSVLTRVRGVWNKHGTAVQNTVTTAYKKLKTIALNAVGQVVTTVKTSLTNVTKLWNKHGTAVKQAATQAYQKAVSLMQGRVQAFVTVVTGTLNRATSLWNRHGKQVKTSIQQAVSSLSPYQAAVASFIPTLAAWATKTGVVTSSLSGLTAGISTGVLPSVSSLGTLITGTLVPALGVKLVGAAKSVVTTLATFAGKTNIAKQAALVFGQKVTVLGGIVSNLKTKASAAGSVLKTVLTAGLTAAKGAVTRLLGPLAGPLFTAFSKLSGIVKRVAGVISSKFIGSIVSSMSRIGPLIARVGSLGSTIGLLTNPIGIAVAAVAGLWLAWKTNFMNIQNKTQQVLDAITAAFNGNSTELKGIVKRTLQAIQDFWNNKLKPVIQTTKTVLDKVGQVFIDTLQFINTNIVQPALQGLLDLWETHGEELKTSVNQLFNFLKGIFKVGAGAILKIWQRWGDEIQAVAKFVIDAVGSVIKTGLDVILTSFNVITDLMAGKWKSALNKILDLGKRIFGGIIDFVKKWGGKLVDYLVTMLSDALQAFIDWGQEIIFGSLIPDIFSAILDFIKNWGGDLLSTLGDALQQGLDAIVSFTEDALSTVQKWGGNVITAVQTMGGEFVSAIKTLATEAFNRISQFISNALSAIQKWGGNVVKAVRTMGGDVVTAIKNMVSDVLGKLGELFRKGKSKVKSLKKKVVGKIESMRTKVFNAVKGMVDDVLGKIDELKSGGVEKVKGMYESVVGGSIIPDMRKESVAEMERMKGEGVGELANLAQGGMSEMDRLHSGAGRAAARMKKGVAKQMSGLSGAVGKEMARAGDVAESEMARMARLTEDAPGVAAAAAAGGGTVNITNIEVNAEVNANSYEEGGDAARAMEDEFDSYLSKN